MAAQLYESLKPKSQYWDKKSGLQKEDYMNKLANSQTVYVGNLSYYTKESSIYELFSQCGFVKRIIIGLDRFKNTPCGFAFVEFTRHEEAFIAVNCLSGCLLDERIIRVD